MTHVVRAMIAADKAKYTVTVATLRTMINKTRPENRRARFIGTSSLGGIAIVAGEDGGGRTI